MLATLLLAACHDPLIVEDGAEVTGASPSTQVDAGPLEAALAAPTPEDEGSKLWTPITLDDQRRLRDGFHWEDTRALSETSTFSYEVDGEPIALPPMHYALIYVETRDQLDALSELGIHYDFAPLFDSEWPEDDQALTLPFEGDPEDRGAQFVFALVPSPVHNLLRIEALAGEPGFRALILRSVPSEARAPDGTVSWDFLLANLTEYAPQDSEGSELDPSDASADDAGVDGAAPDDVPDAAVEAEARAGAAQQKGLGGRLRKLARRAAKAVKRVTDHIRRVVGKAALAVLPDTQITLQTHVDPRSNVPLTRAWDDGRGGYGQPLALTGLRVALSGRSRLSLYRATLDEHGVATLKVPRSLTVNVCFEADTPAARMERGVLRVMRHCWPKHRPQGKKDTLDGEIGAPEFHALALIVDAQAYARVVLGFTPPKATVQVGFLADKLSQDGRASTPCLAAPNAPPWIVTAYAGTLNAGAGFASIGTGGLLPPIPVGALAELALTTDMLMPRAGQRSRNVSVHEYGHFVFCTLLHSASKQSYRRVWSQVMQIRNLVGERDTAAVALNEGFADWFASQASGGVNYFSLNRGGDSENVDDGSFFIDSRASVSGRGMEENIGGPTCGKSELPGCGISSGLGTPGEAVATVATVLHDAIDRAACGSDRTCSAEKRSDGAVWIPPADSRDPFTPEQPFAIADVADETIALSPRGIVAAVRHFARSNGPVGAQLSYQSFFRSLTHVMKDEGYGDAEICNLYALHRPSGTCPEAWTGIAPQPSISVAIASNPSGAGEIQGTGLGGPACAAGVCTVPAGGTLALTASARPDFVFERWSGCSTETSPAIQLRNLTSATGCSARFHPTRVTVGLAVVGAGRVAGPSSACSSTACNVPFGSNLTLTALPDSGWDFAGWSGCSSAATQDITLTQASADVTCTARFVQTYPVFWSADGLSSASATASPGRCSGGVCNVDQGGRVTLLMGALSGAKVDGWDCTDSATGRVVSSRGAADPRSLRLDDVRGAWRCVAHSSPSVLL